MSDFNDLLFTALFCFFSCFSVNFSSSFSSSTSFTGITSSTMFSTRLLMGRLSSCNYIKFEQKFEIFLKSLTKVWKKFKKVWKGLKKILSLYKVWKVQFFTRLLMGRQSSCNYIKFEVMKLWRFEVMNFWSYELIHAVKQSLD